jgi:ubiquinone/menaquinone biosynthesis C-methylase UbiE
VKRSVLSALRCPACQRELELDVGEENEQEVTTGSLLCVCGKVYTIEDGIPNLIYPDELLPSDKEFRQKYEEGAEEYDIGLDWLFRSFYEDEDAIRSRMLELLDLRPDSRVLEIGCGSGKDSLHIVASLKERGELYAQDISLGMLRLARRRLTGSATSIQYFLSNAAYLPFADAHFDAVFHFGGLNTFGEIKRSLAEMTRVVRVGGRVVVGDEGVSPWLRKTMFGRILINANPLYKHKPPLEHLPENARDVCLRWILGNAFYVIDYRLGTGPPKVDLDLPIPGKGDSLRSRYETRVKRRI